MKFNFVRFACSCLTLIGLTSTATASEYYRRITPEELKKERTQKKCEFVWSEMGEKLISEMAIDYQNALFVTNMNSEVDSKKAEMQEMMKKYPDEFGIRYTQLFVIPAIDQLENSLDLVRDTILPSALKQNGFYYDPEEKPADSLMADLKKDPTSIACYKGKYYEVWQYKTDSDRMKTSIVYTPLGYEKIKILYREEANIKVDYTELKNTFSNAAEQRRDIQEARNEHPLDYGQFLGEDYQWVLCETWREVIVKPTSTEEK